MQNQSRLTASLKAVGEFAGTMIFWAERLCLLAIEGIRRTIMRLNPRLYRETLRVIDVTEGRAPNASGKFAVFLIYTRGTVPGFTMNFIAALDRCAFNTIIVSNGQLNPDARADLMSRCCLLVRRVNFGLDFGGYKDGIRIAFERFAHIRRLIIANDSVFYLDHGLDELIARLDIDDGFAGVSEVYEHHYHAASFLLSFGPDVLADPAFHRFWTRYRPIHTRMWTILEGEGALTARLINAGHRPSILYRADHLLPKLQALSAVDAGKTLALVPGRVREKLPVVANGETTDKFAEALVSEIMARNQMHAAGFLFAKFLSLPLFKRDIVYRELFTSHEVRQIVAELGIAMRGEIMADLTRRAPPAPSSVLRRVLYRHGFI